MINLLNVGDRNDRTPLEDAVEIIQDTKCKFGRMDSFSCVCVCVAAVRTDRIGRSNKTLVERVAPEHRPHRIRNSRPFTSR